MSAITACIICKNEEAHIEKCILALKALQVPLVIADTGSTDRTVSLARPLLSPYDKLCHFDWCNDFSAARNFCAAQARTDWIWMVDADEYLVSYDAAALTSFLTDPANEMTIGTIARKDAYPLQGEITYAVSRMGRIYNRLHYHYECRIHEQLIPGTLDVTRTPSDTAHTETNPDCYFDLPLFFDHMGYETQEILNRKCKRNISLLKLEYQEQKDPYIAYQLGKSYAGLEKHHEAVRYFEEGLSFDLDPSLQYVQSMVQAYGYSLLELREFERALSFESIYDAFAVSADFVFLMGLIYMNNARFEKAIAEFDKASAFPACTVEGVNSWRAHYNKGVVLECTGRITEAIDSYKRCGDFAPALQRLKIINNKQKLSGISDNCS